jgi:hypothetical protein
MRRVPILARGSGTSSPAQQLVNHSRRSGYLPPINYVFVERGTSLSVVARASGLIIGGT